MDMLNQKQKIILIGIAVVTIIVMIFQYFNSTKEIYSYEDNLNISEEQEKISKLEEKEEKIIIHITGAVKNERNC